jgi:hypothetical protein
MQFLREGLTNKEIAERLNITLDGAKYHVSSILSKLGASSRIEASAWQPAQESRGRWSWSLLALGKLAGVAVAASAIVGVGALGYGVMMSGGGDGANGEASALDLGATETLPSEAGEPGATHGLSLTDLDPPSSSPRPQGAAGDPGSGGGLPVPAAGPFASPAAGGLPSTTHTASRTPAATPTPRPPIQECEDCEDDPTPTAHATPPGCGDCATPLQPPAQPPSPPKPTPTATATPPPPQTQGPPPPTPTASEDDPEEPEGSKTEEPEDTPEPPETPHPSETEECEGCS